MLPTGWRIVQDTIAALLKGETMNTRLWIAAIAASSSLMLAGCAGTGPNQQIGVAGGAVGGAVLGNVLGGSTAATVGGAAIGGLIGNEVGKNSDRRNDDRRYRSDGSRY
jgi:osmotically inducible lipoprotein OsmB